VTNYQVDRRPPYFIPFAARNVADPPTKPSDHPRGYVNQWDAAEGRAEAELFLRDHFWNPFSRRIGLHNPLGRGPSFEGQKNTSGQWLSDEPWRRELLIRVCGEFLAESDDHSIEVYGGGRQWNPHSLEPGNWIDLHPDDPLSVRRWQQTALPWAIDVGAHRLWYDNVSALDKRSAFLLFARWARQQYGLTLGMEAVPLDYNGLGTLVGIDRTIWRDCPFLCLARFALSPYRQNFPLTCPPDPDQEGVILVSGHSISPTQKLPTAIQIEQLRAAGWVVGSLGWQPQVLKLVYGSEP
jgi:hypothetical protein